MYIHKKKTKSKKDQTLLHTGENETNMHRMEIKGKNEEKK